VNERQRLEIRAIELRGQLRELATAEGDWGDEERARRDELTGELGRIEERIAVLIAAGDGPPEPDPDTTTPEERELATLRAATGVVDFASAALAGRAADGAARDYAQALEIPETGPGGGVAFPLRLLDPGAAAATIEGRTETDADSMASQADWLGRIFARTASEFLGITRRSVPAGVATFPVQATGPTPAQRARGEAIAAGDMAWTVTSSQLKPKRMAASVEFEAADVLRLPGLAEQLTMDLRDALTERMDRVVFLGDAGADGADADIAGLFDLPDLAAAGARRATLTQAQKVLAANWLKALAGMLDGEAAAEPSDIRVVLSVGAMTLIAGTFGLASNRTEQTIRQILMAQGYSFMSRAGIATASDDGDNGAIVSLGRGLPGSGVHAVWEAGELIRDPYTDAQSGGVRLTLSAYHDLGFPRETNFRSIGFVS